MQQAISPLTFYRTLRAVSVSIRLLECHAASGCLSRATSLRQPTLPDGGGCLTRLDKNRSRPQVHRGLVLCSRHARWCLSGRARSLSIGRVPFLPIIPSHADLPVSRLGKMERRPARPFSMRYSLYQGRSTHGCEARRIQLNMGPISEMGSPALSMKVGRIQGITWSVSANCVVFMEFVLLSARSARCSREEAASTRAVLDDESPGHVVLATTASSSACPTLRP